MGYQRPLSNNNDIFWIEGLMLVCSSLPIIYTNAYIGQVPGDFLGSRLHSSLLLTQVPTFTCQYASNTPQRRHMSAWDLSQDFLKMCPSMPAVQWLGKHTKQTLTAGCDFGRGWEQNTSESKKTSSNGSWMKMGQTEATRSEVARSAPDSTCHRGHPSPLWHPRHVAAAELWPPPPLFAAWWPKQYCQLIRSYKFQRT